MSTFEPDQVPGKKLSADIHAYSEREDCKLCQPCSKIDKRSTATVFCTICNEFQCTNCSEIHKAYAFMKNHQLRDVKEVMFDPYWFNIEEFGPCDQHDELLKYFCEDEKQLCCSTCAVVDHRKCNSIVEVQKLDGKSLSNGTELKPLLQKLKSDTETILTHIKSEEENLHRNINDIPKKIKCMTGQVNSMFKDLKLSLTKNIDMFQSKTLEELGEIDISCNHVIEKVKDYLDTTEDVYRNGTPSQRFIVEHKIEKEVSELEKRFEEACDTHEKVSIALDLSEGAINLPPISISDCLPAQLTVKYRFQENKDQIKCGHLTIEPIQIASIDLKEASPYKCSKEPLYTGLAFLENGRLIVVDNSNRICLIFNEKLEPVATQRLNFTPQSVVAISETDVAITSGPQHKIHFLHVSESNKITLTRTCIVTTQYDSICLNNDGKFVAGTFNDTRPVRLVSQSGEEENFSIRFPNKIYPHFGSTACTYMSSNKKVIITDRFEHTVYIYDVATNTRIVVKDDQIKEPRGLAVGPSDVIFVCSSETHSIVQITPKGRILSSYKLDMKYPYRVCICEDKSRMAVTNNFIGNMKLQLLKLAFK